MPFCCLPHNHSSASPYSAQWRASSAVLSSVTGQLCWNKVGCIVQKQHGSKQYVSRHSRPEGIGHAFLVCPLEGRREKETTLMWTESGKASSKIWYSSQLQILNDNVSDLWSWSSSLYGGKLWNQIGSEVSTYGNVWKHLGLIPSNVWMYNPIDQIMQTI